MAGDDEPPPRPSHPPKGHPDASPPHDPIEVRRRIDRSCRAPVVFFFASATAWLLIGSVLALVASMKMHSPELLTSTAALTFGRVRPAHLNTMIYGWASMAGIGAILWLQARLSRVPLPWGRTLVAMGVLWNLIVLAGTFVILVYGGTSVEWLEFPRWVAYSLAVPFLLLAVVSVAVFRERRVHFVYVSQWYLFGAVFWFPLLYITANLLIHGDLAVGVSQATTNWWFAHNVLGLWLTPVGLAAIYYLIPKVIGRPIHSYYLSLLGFWTLALFYNWAGTHHLIGGPLPLWVVSVGTVASMMMLIPVTAVAINHHMTMFGHFKKLRFSPTLRFIVFGGMAYTAVSVQGSFQALRLVNETSHFTHYTVAHAHLGVYAFFTMSMYGVIYYVVPRLVEREWPSARLIRIHFWGTALGMILYWVGLTIGGWFQGRMMNDASIPFLDIVEFTKPFLVSRTVAGISLTTGHVAFAILMWRMLVRRETAEEGPTLLGRPAPAKEGG
jgi:cytochrome c oxidase cbb3-type subunit 1